MLRFTVLGPVGASFDGREVPPVAPRHRAVLAYLLLHARTAISADRLVGAMWGLTPPDTARAQVQASVAVIRRVLREAGAPELLVTRSAGYVLQTEPGQLDLEEFTGALAGARTAGEVRAALGLWQGQALADVHADFVEEARTRLEDRRLGAVERLAELELEAGNHASLIDELAAQVAAHPLRERLSGHLMLALHRAGRQADALAVARAFRAALAEDQGLDPSKTFLALERSVLHDDEPAPAQPTTRQSHLPYDLPDFTGRAPELARLVESPTRNRRVVTISAIDGMAGIGKTALAVHVAHRLAEHFPDGHLFVDLHGHTPGQVVCQASTALEMLLLQLGVTPDRLPVTLADRAALWRSELVNRRVLVVLDNALDADQVRSLMPGASNSFVLITSRRRLVDLDGAFTLSLDVLPADEAVELFTTIVGDRAVADQDAVMTVLRLCGFLPLAVRIAAARLRHRSTWSVAYLAERLGEQGRRLPELSTAERGVAAAFTLSYRQLDEDQQRMFRLLGLHPGADVDAYAAASLADLPLWRADEVLGDLLDAHLLMQHEPGRFTFHDLLREHAGATALEHGPEEDALARMFDHYLYTASQAIDLLFPDGTARRPRVLRPGTPRLELADRDGAAAWLDAERVNLVKVAVHAADLGRPGYSSAMSITLFRYLNNHAHFLDASALAKAALRAAENDGDLAGEARALIDLAVTQKRLGLTGPAVEYARLAVSRHEELGDRFGEARSLLALGRFRLEQGAYDEAYTFSRRAAEAFDEVGEPINRAAAECGYAAAYREQGRYEEALAVLDRARAVFRSHGHTSGEAHVLHSIGLVNHRQGHNAEAIDHHLQALAIYRELRMKAGEMEVLNSLGEAFRSAHDPARAVEDHTLALDLASSMYDRWAQAQAHAGLAHAHRDLGRSDLARAHAAQALHLLTELRSPEANGVRLLLAAL
ncbi:BTAD domain-containing putative transcriptional regulator [Nonomuraea sp. NPDC050556]|uniref:AfsR/SARP family transcriptional regulator n=1 Tax=Nonomuraea sp. NPDC050556 TaxID=3364369 RepID=UPI00379FBCB4